jgi:hypothetical protein
VSARYAREGRAWRYEPAHWSNQEMREGDDYRRWKHDRNNDGDNDRDHKGNDHHGDHDRDGNHR